MFVQVQQITTMIDERIGWFQDAVASKDEFEEHVFNEYVKDMTQSLKRNIETLKRISTNNKLIARYEDKVENALKGW